MLDPNEALRKQELERFDRIGPTAWMTASWRTYSDIPLSAEIFKELEIVRIEADAPPIPGELLERTIIATQLEARYKLVDRLLHESWLEQVLEIASGMAPRGLILSGELQQYVELDLPSMMSEKRKIIQSLEEKGIVKVPATLHLMDGSGLEDHDLDAATAFFDRSQPIAVINEGLMRYLSFEERAVLATNIRGLLIKFGGIWITPDITMRKVLNKENELSKGHVERITALTGVDIAANRFEDEEHARKFFEDLGFEVERHSFMEVANELVSPKALGISDGQLQDATGEAVVFVMRPIT